MSRLRHWSCGFSAEIAADSAPLSNAATVAVVCFPRPKMCSRVCRGAISAASATGRRRAYDNFDVAMIWTVYQDELTPPQVGRGRHLQRLKTSSSSRGCYTPAGAVSDFPWGGAASQSRKRKRGEPREGIELLRTERLGGWICGNHRGGLGFTL